MCAKMWERKTARESRSFADAENIESDENPDVRRRKARNQISALMASGWVILPMRNSVFLLR